MTTPYRRSQVDGLMNSMYHL